MVSIKCKFFRACGAYVGYTEKSRVHGSGYTEKARVHRSGYTEKARVHESGYTEKLGYIVRVHRKS